MRRCKVSMNVRKNGKWVTETFELGFFHCWGCSFEEFENGAGNYSIAIVELPNGKIIMPMPNEIEFITESEE